MNIDKQFDLSAIDAELVPLKVQVRIIVTIKYSSLLVLYNILMTVNCKHENYINYRPSADVTFEKFWEKIIFDADSISSGDMIDVQMRKYQKRQLPQISCLL